MARKQKTIHYLYKTTCLITGRWYIGMHSTHNLDDGYMGSGRRLRASLRKYGVDNHIKEILEFFESRELLIEAEKEAITAEMVLDKNCMNLMCGGTGGYISEEQQRHRSMCAGLKFSEIRKNNPDVDQQYREKHRKIIIESYTNGTRLKNVGNKSFSGRTHTDETKEKMRKSKKGKYDGVNHPQYGMCWVTKEGLNKKIKKELLDQYLNQGWVKGRIIKKN